MTIQIMLALVASLGVIVGMIWNRLPAEWLMMAAVAFLLVTGVLTPAAAIHGFSNKGMLTVGALYVVAAGVQETGGLRFAVDYILGRPKSAPGALVRLMPFVATLSAFLNNTPIVAMMIGVVQHWARQCRLPVSRLLLPLSYAAILGGTLTLIGTSTNLIVNGLLQSRLHISLGLFSIFPVGIVILCVGVLWMLLFGWRLLPKGEGLLQALDDVREYSVIAQVVEGSHLDGQSIAKAKLRHLDHGYLAEIERHGRLLATVNEETVLQEQDRLFFVGSAECAKDVYGLKGLSIDGGEQFNLEQEQRCFVEVVLSPRSPLVGLTVRKANFRSQYRAVIMAVSRNGKRLVCKTGDVELKAGDTLLLSAQSDFEPRYRHSTEFLLVSRLSQDKQSMKVSKKAPLALLILIGMIVAHIAGFISMVGAAIVAAVLMVLLGCLTPTRAAKSVNGSVLVVIAGALALGHAITSTGAANLIASYVLHFSDSPWLALALAYIVTALFTELITNNAAAVLMFPIGLALSQKLGVSVMPFAVAIMFAASASFLTPLGYQTNLMVYGPGGYKLVDYIKAGLPMAVLVAISTIVVVPHVFPF